MAEDDEIDILGDFNLDNFLVKNNTSIYGSASLVSQNTELLNCDYTIHPQWLLDKPSANPDNWYDTNLSRGLEKTRAENDGHVSTENSITDESGWTEKEKNLLDRGIEIFGKSNVRLSQFIGSRTAAEVKYYFKNFYQENQNVYKHFHDGVVEEIGHNNLNVVSDVLDDAQIPATMEEVIASVSTAKPTIQIHKRARKRSSSSSLDMYELNSKDVPSRQSLLKANYLKTDAYPVRLSKIKKHELCEKQRRSKNKSVRFKFKQELKTLVSTNQRRNNQKRIRVRRMPTKKAQFSKIEITTGKGLAVPISEGEEIVKIKNVDNDSDLDVEIEVEDTVEKNEQKTITNNSHQVVVQTQSAINNHQQDMESTQDNTELQRKQGVDFATLDESVVKQLMDLEKPKYEVILNENSITELEKFIHFEFFEGRPTKTPSRYLKIRNHIINTWKSTKPNYITKTSVRQGLKKCGDVTCIGRIHNFLEQIGAINFGCAQVNYVRPLYTVIQPSTVPREKSIKDVKCQTKPIKEFSSRPRNRKKFTNNGEGGCTLTHDENGDVINTVVISEKPVGKKKFFMKKPRVPLMYCRNFTEDKPQPYTIKFHLSTLLTIDFHAHTSLTEVMGLVGGYWIPQNKVLTLSHYELCLNVASSATHCDMCPISQARAADMINNKGLDVLGWFHSHPTFAPEPSHQDIETQEILQQTIGHNRPCIGVILSPFCSNGALIASPFRCMIVDKDKSVKEKTVPFKFNVVVTSEDFDVQECLKDIQKVFKAYIENAKESKVKFSSPYFQDSSISYLEKYISSVRMHLAKCGTLKKMTCDMIIQGISDICSNNKII